MFPLEVWDHILGYGGPLSEATDVRWVACVRIQRRWRAVQPLWEHGESVRFAHADGRWQRGRLLWPVCEGMAWMIARDGKKHSYVFLPQANVRVRKG